MTTYLPTISVVTPSFNQAKYLEECIESVLGQGYPNLEYIIMDGGSTDGSQEIIKKYEKYLTYWQSQPDGGQYQAINEGFRHTSGQIMAWLNSDDKYHPLAFAKVASTFAMNPDVRWLTGRMCYWDAEGDLVRINNNLPVFSRLKYLEGHYDKPYIQQESTFWDRSLWEEVGAMLGVTEKLAGDLGLWCRFFRHEQLYTLDSCLGGYRHYGEQRGITMAAVYEQEASELLEQERTLFQQQDVLLPPSPKPLTVSREQLAAFCAAYNFKVESPSLRTCWRHYTENMIGIVNEMQRERSLSMVPVIKNELLMLGLIKPAAVTLTADRLEELSAARIRAETLRTQGNSYADCGDYSAAEDSYCRALERWPTCIDAAADLLVVLWKQNRRQDALNLIVKFLPIAAHERGFVLAVANILTGYGATLEAAGVCDEYIMTNPHDSEVKNVREKLICQQ